MSNKLYTDGACSPNPGKGGYGSILILENGERKEFSSGFKLSTNNRMELLSIIEPLESFSESCTIEIISDSKYIVNAINENWLKNWVKKSWKKSDNKTVANIDLWKRLIVQLKKHNLSFTWVKGHNGHDENEECDQMAVMARKKEDLRDDDNYNQEPILITNDSDDIFSKKEDKSESEFIEAKLELEEGNNFGFTLLWAAKEIGFGEFVFFLDEEGNLTCDNECMSRDFVKKALCALVDNCKMTDEKE